MMSCSSILRIGGPLGSDVPISILKKELSNHFTSKEDNDDDCDDRDNLFIQNKYFNARIRLLPSLTQDQSGENDSHEDGIILVFPSSTDIDSLTESHTSITNATNCGDTLRLCLSTSFGPSASIGTTKEYEMQYSERVHWCLDHGYEYIEVDVSEDGLKRGFDEREKDGFARVVEAIGGTVWSCAVMKKRENKVQQQPSTQCKDGGERENDVEREKEQEEKVHSPASSHLQTEGQILENEDLKESDKDEVLMDNFEKVLKEAKMIRDASRSGKLLDDERRQRAGDAAEILMGLLGQMGFDDESDESSDGD